MLTVYRPYAEMVSRSRWRLLLALLILAILIDGTTSTSRITAIVSVVLYTLVSYGTLHLANPPRWIRHFGLAVLAFWLLLYFTDLGLGSAVGEALRVSASSVLVVGALMLTFQQLFDHEMSDVDRLAGAVFGYFLMAMAWAMLFINLELSGPGAFNGIEAGNQGAQFIYFSFVTITSLGYGDISPESPLARILSGFEAATGMLYIAVLIGRVVGRFR